MIIFVDLIFLLWTDNLVGVRIGVGLDVLIMELRYLNLIFEVKIFVIIRILSLNVIGITISIVGRWVSDSSNSESFSLHIIYMPVNFDHKLQTPFIITHKFENDLLSPINIIRVS
jgi:hypothetical protein